MYMECLPDQVCRFTCRDNGIGMSKEFIAHITEDYVRAEDSRVSKTQGTGLGMSVVKGFVDLMKGKLTVNSQLGAGSEFIVEIPFEEATQEQKDTILCPAEKNTDGEDSLHGKKVLLAEDNALNAEIAMELPAEHRTERGMGRERKRGCRTIREFRIRRIFCSLYGYADASDGWHRSHPTDSWQRTGRQ